MNDARTEEKFPEVENSNLAIALCGWRGSQLELLSSRCNEGDLAGTGAWFDACPVEWRDFAKWLLGLAKKRLDDLPRIDELTQELEKAREICREVAGWDARRFTDRHGIIPRAKAAL